MQILIIGKFYTEGFALHIAETLTAMDHQVRRFEPGFKSQRLGGQLGHRLDQVRRVIHEATDSLPAIRAHRMKALWKVAEQEFLDVVIVGYDFLWPEEVAELKHRTHAKVAMWYPDPIVNFRRAYFMNAPYDALFFKDPYIVYAMGDVLQSPVYYLPECFNPERHFLAEAELGNLTDYQCDITTAGNLHSWRVAFYKNLSAYHVKIWGNPAPLWMAAGEVKTMHQGRSVFNHDKVRAFRGAKIVVNNLIYGEIWGVNVRCFEAAGAGAFQMVDWRPGLSHLFEEGKEIITFKSIVELKQKIDYWLPREAERRAIAEAGRLRAHAEHTYQLRLELLLDTLAGNAQGFPIPDCLKTM
jgi:spore maturation protein CgeB